MCRLRLVDFLDRIELNQAPAKPVSNVPDYRRDSRRFWEFCWFERLIWVNGNYWWMMNNSIQHMTSQDSLSQFLGCELLHPDKDQKSFGLDCFYISISNTFLWCTAHKSGIYPKQLPNMCFLIVFQRTSFQLDIYLVFHLLGCYWNGSIIL